MRVLIACEHSGVVREAFVARGHDAWSCDILPSLVPGQHLQCDVRKVLDGGWDLMVAHPPCTYLSYAGTRWWNNPGRAEKREAAMQFFMELVNAPVPHICVENPLGLPSQRYRKPDQVIHPYYFGEPELKRTCLWLKNLPPLWWQPQGGLWEATAVERPQPVSIERSGKKRYFTDGKNRDPLKRSRTFASIANAMADQWGAWIESHS